MGPPPLGNLSDKTLKIPHSERNKLSSSLMQADNRGEAEKKNSSEVTGAASYPSTVDKPSPSSGDASGRGFSFEVLDKLIAERNKVLSETKKLLQKNGNSVQPQPYPADQNSDTKPSSIVPASPSTENRNILNILTELGKLRVKHHETVRGFATGHTSILGHEYIYKEIDPLLKELNKS